MLGPAPRTAAQWVGFARIDWQAAERQRFTLEGIGAALEFARRRADRASKKPSEATVLDRARPARSGCWRRWEAFLTPNLLAVTQASAGREISERAGRTLLPPSSKRFSARIWGQLPQIIVDTRYGFTIGNPSRFGQGSYPDERLYQAQEMVDWVRGKLACEGRLRVDHNSDATSLLRNQTGTYYLLQCAELHLRCAGI